MITKWKVFNFKSIRNETELELGPLTIFAGANSSGKSTLIQSILLVAQTLAHKVSSRSVVLNGALTSLGQFDDLKSNGNASDQITIKFTNRPLQEVGLRIASTMRNATYFGTRFGQLHEVSCEISFDADPSSPQRDIFQIQPRLFSTHLSCLSRDEENIDQRSDILIRHSNKGTFAIEGLEIPNEIKDQIRSSLAFAVKLDDNSNAEIREEFRSANPIGCTFRHFLPERIICSIDTVQEDASAIVQALQDDGRRMMGLHRAAGREICLSREIIAVLREVLAGVINFDHVFMGDYQQELLFDKDPEIITLRNYYDRLRALPLKDKTKVLQAFREKDDLFDVIYQAMKLSPNSTSEKLTIAPMRLPRQLIDASSYIDKFFSTSLKYLGPLRDAPKPLYPLAPAADPNDIGLRGEHTAFILELHKNKKIRYIPSDNFKTSSVEHRIITRTLESSVIDWLQYLGVAEIVESHDKGKLGHELKVGLANSDSTHDLTHVGVGVSQVLPILVMCLLSDTDSTLVFEQPELHLHPKVQTLLGDFFLSMALCKKQCIIETHSEYLIDRLRFRIAAAPPEDELNNQAKIYFVEKPSQGSSFREVVINEYGAISDWPDGFFDQSQQQAEAILTAALAKKRAKKNKD